MKHLLLGITILALMLTSCSTDELITNEEAPAASMLESFLIKRNADGSYALTHEVSEGVSSDYSNSNGVNEIYLYSDDISGKSSNMREYRMENNRLHFAFSDENNSQLPRINILDDNTKENKIGLLKTYSIEANKNNTVQVNFTVEKGVNVVYGYNQTDKINEIRLSQGNNNVQTDYSKQYTKEIDNTLRVDFVQEANKDNETKKPRFIID